MGGEHLTQAVGAGDSGVQYSKTEAYPLNAISVERGFDVV